MKRVVLLLITALSISFNARAQETDLGLSMGAEVSKKFGKSFELQVEEEVRMTNDISRFDRAMTSLGANYSISKTFKTGVAYTWLYVNNTDDDLYENRHRFTAFVQAAKKAGNFKFSLREKFVTTFRDEDLDPKYNPKSYLRSRLQAGYNIPKFPVNPYASAEMYYQLNNPKGNEIDKWRYQFGVDYKISKLLTFDIYCRLDREANKKNPENITYLGVMAKFSL